MLVWNFLTWLLLSSASEVGLIGRHVSLLHSCLKKNCQQNTVHGMLLTPTHTVPIGTNVAHLCQRAQRVPGARSTAWSTIYFWSSKPSDCRIFKSWWTWVLVDEVGLIKWSLLWPLVAIAPGNIIECPLLLWPLVATAPGDITKCRSLLWPWVATSRLCQCARCYFWSLTNGPTMKLFNIASPKFGV
jgi:hypothetical protein